jgi:hypothetical protein
MSRDSRSIRGSWLPIDHFQGELAGSHYVELEEVDHLNLVELEEVDHLVAEAWSSISRSSKMDRILIATRSEHEHAQANKHICIKALHHTKEKIIKTSNTK